MENHALSLDEWIEMIEENEALDVQRFETDSPYVAVQLSDYTLMIEKDYYDLLLM